MNRFFRNKNLAFTLAEMMVILALFSTIAAATLPVVTARRAIDVSDLATGGSTLDPWLYSNTYNGLSYYNTISSLATTSAVMVGGQVSADAYSIGYPQLIVKNNQFSSVRYSGSEDDFTPSHIIFLKRQSIEDVESSYYAGRIVMGDNEDGIIKDNCIAIGAHAMSTRGQWGYFENSVAIGSYASRSGHNGETYKNNVSIGYANRNLLESSVAIGSENCPYSRFDVCIGSSAGGNNSEKSVLIGKNISMKNLETVSIGAYIGNEDMESNDENSQNVNIGQYAALGAGISNSISIGTSTNQGVVNHSEIVSIGHNAGRGMNVSGGVSIGLDAGFNIMGEQAVIIGSEAGQSIYFSGTSPVIIGKNAAYTLYTASDVNGDGTSPVIIGTEAFKLDGGSKSISSLPSVAIGERAASTSWEGDISSLNMNGSVIIGRYAGWDAKTLANSICIGEYTCAESEGNFDVRISPNGYYKPSGYDSDGYLRNHTSFIGNPGAIDVFGNYLTVDQKYNLFAQSSRYANMILSPVTDGNDAPNSSIIFYANTVYGPKTTFEVLSDKRLKENIRLSKYGLSNIRKINIYEYNYINDGNDSKDSQKRHIGVIAQEMKEIIPEGVKTLPSGYYSVRADWLIFPMVNAIKELDKSVESLRKTLSEYINEYVILVSRVKSLEKEVKTLERENKILQKNVSIAYKKAKNAERRQ